MWRLVKESMSAALAPWPDWPSWRTNPAASLARMGALGDWIVDFAFGDVHTRPGLSARDRELIIVAVLTALGSSDPQVGAHIRALRAIDVPGARSRRRSSRPRPTRGSPEQSTQ